MAPRVRVPNGCELGALNLSGRAFLKKCFDLVLEGLFINHAWVGFRDCSVAVNEQGQRKKRKSAVSIGQVLVANYDAIIQLVLFEKWPH